MLLGDISQTLRLAARGTLDEAELRLFNPIGCMLATPIEAPSEILESFLEWSDARLYHRGRLW